VTQWKV